MSPIETRESHSLISSDRVEGTAVYNPQGERLGTISSFMVDKVSGEVAYAVLSYGGLFGFGSDRYPLPWDVLTYDTDQGGYVVALDRELLEKAPRYRESEPDFGPDYNREVYSYYGLSWPFLP